MRAAPPRSAPIATPYLQRAARVVALRNATSTSIQSTLPAPREFIDHKTSMITS